MKVFLLVISLGTFNFLSAQNFGIGTANPSEKLEVVGNSRSNGFIYEGAGALYDFLTKINAEGEVGFKKGHGALGINYMICIQGVFPSPNGPSGEATAPISSMSEESLMGQIRIIAGNTIPRGWALCNGQLLPVNQNQALFGLLGYTYGGGGLSFALPDLRGAVPVCQGTNTAGYTWTRAQKSD